MEKRVLLAVALSGLVLVVWYALFAPPPVAPPSQGPEPLPRATAATTAAAEVAREDVAAARARRPPLEAARAEVPGEAVLETDDFRVVVDGAGGVISSIVLKGYRDDQGNLLELVSAGGPRPLALAAVGPWNHEGHVLVRDGDAVTLRWSDGEGLSLIHI